MKSKAETLAQQFEARIQQALDILDRLDAADWERTTEAERWSVGVTAHHLASVLEPIADMVRAVAAGHSSGRFTLAMFDAMNAAHARAHARCTKAETVKLLRRGATVAAGVIRGLNADELERKGTVVMGLPPMTAKELIAGALLAHIDQHFGSIRRTVATGSGGVESAKALDQHIRA